MTLGSPSAQIKQILSMRQVAEQYGFTPDRSGFIRCPFHQDKTASLKIYDEPGRGFCCFGCGTAGSVIDFVMRLLDLSLPQALIRINADFGLGIFAEKPDRRKIEACRKEQDRKRRLEKSRHDELNRLAAEHCRLWWALKSGEPYGDPWCEALYKISDIEERLEVVVCQTN